MSDKTPIGGDAPSRRKFLRNAGALGAATLFGGHAPAVLAQSKSPLKLGVLNSFSGVYTALGTGNLNGMNLYFEQIGNSIAGRKIEIVREDDQVNPQIGLQKLKKLVESDECDIITGIQASNVAMASIQYLGRSKAFTLCSGAGTADLSYINLPYFFRSSISTNPVHASMGEWIATSITKEVVLTATDFAGGRNSLAEFKSGYLKNGGRVIKEIYPPFANNDFSAYLVDIRNIAPPATFSFYAGTDAVRFVKQYSEYGLSAKSRLTGSGFMVDSDTLPAQGRSALGVLNCLHYADTLDNPANKKFVADYLARYKEYPSVYSEYGYVAAQILHQALQAVDGNTSDKEKLRAAMLALKLNVPRGPFRFNPATHSPIQNVYIREVAEVDGRLTNKVVHTFPNVVEPSKRTA